MTIEETGLLLFVRRMLRVAVIGAGAAGLCVARHVLSHLKVFTPPVVFELSEKVGGTWCYDERVGRCDNGWPIHSSMYRDLRYGTGQLSDLTSPLLLSPPFCPPEPTCPRR